MNEDQLRKRAARGRSMKEWAHGPEGLFAVFDAVEKDYFRSIAASEPTETAFRDAVYHRVRAIKDIRRVMDAVISDGAGADAIIAKLSNVERSKTGRRTRSLA